MDFLTQLREQVRARLEARTARQAELDTLLETPTAENRALNETESTAFAEHRQALATMDAEIDQLVARRTELEAEAERRTALAAQLRDLGQPATTTGGSVHIRAEERTYRQGGEHSFLADLFGAQVLHNRAAEDRISRHTTEELMERRDINASALAGAIPPQYLVDWFAPVARAGRPFLNALNSLPLPPEGLSFVVPRGTTGASGAMTAEGSAFSETDEVVTDLTSTVNLVTSQQDISRAIFMRGGPVVDQLLFPDLISAAETALDASALNGNGTAPQHRGVTQVASINAVTYTDASPTVAEAWPKLADAIQQINSLRFMPGNLIVMHPRRWGWVTSAVDSSGRPLFEFSTVAPNSVIGLGKAAEYGQVVGTLMGLPVVTDANVATNLGAGTNEDQIIVVRTFDFGFWEDDIFQLTFEQTIGPEKVRLAVGKFSLFIPGRYPKSISTIGGTGLVPPTF